MTVRYSNEPNELDIEATATDFQELSTKLMEDGSTMGCESVLTPEPYSQLLESVVVKFSPGQNVELRVIKSSLVISGDSQKLAVLSENMANFGKEWLAGEHIHLEYYEGHPFLSKASIPTVLTHS
jgi:hypothetical protein